nr:defense protein 6-like [Maniola hyperantus]
MKACVVLAIFLIVAFVATSQCEEIEDNNYNPVHVLQKRQLWTPRPNIPRCTSWECSSSCRRAGRHLGGYCTLTGCNCL